MKYFEVEMRSVLPRVAGGFGCLVADPPWRFKAGQASRIKPPYPTLSLDEICELPVKEIVAPRALLFLWCPHSFTEQAFRIARDWGFVPVSQLVWVKRSSSGKLQIGMGSYVRCAHELVLIGTRGGQTGLVRNVPSVLEAPRAEHSRKPDALLEIAEQLAPGPRIELFARRRRRGWKSWGNELDANGAAA